MWRLWKESGEGFRYDFLAERAESGGSFDRCTNFCARVLLVLHVAISSAWEDI